ncbi:hypothetical protein MRB53_039477 [Persea americana]|nr:hypothetical protein MRB53_039477 [Persea americana]
MKGEWMRCFELAAWVMGGLRRGAACVWARNGCAGRWDDRMRALSRAARVDLQDGVCARRGQGETQRQELPIDDGMWADRLVSRVHVCCAPHERSVSSMVPGVDCIHGVKRLEGAEGDECDCRSEMVG